MNSLQGGLFRSHASGEVARRDGIDGAQRRAEIRSLGGGNYMFQGHSKPVEQQLSPRNGAGPTTVDLVLDVLRQNPGLTSVQIADRVEGQMVHSDAKDKRKSIHSVLNYLLKKRIYRDSQGRIFIKQAETTAA